MARILLYILVPFGLCSFCGCQRPAEPATPKSDVDITGIKIEDIKPANTVNLPPQIVFRIFTFEIAADKLEETRQAFALLDRKPLRFVNYDSFQANGFAAGFGRRQNWQGIAQVLGKAGAARTETRNLVIYDDAGDDIALTRAGAELAVSYFDNDADHVVKQFLPGRFSWNVRARHTATIRGVAQVEVRPIYRFGTDSFISNLAEYRDLIPFDGGAFGFKVSKGDFVLLGPTSHHLTKLTLGSLLFTKPKNDSVARLYMIGCVRVAD